MNTRRHLNTNRPIVRVRGRLKQLLAQNKWTQEYVAEKSGIAQAKLSRFDQSVTLDPSTIASLMEGLELSYWDLFEKIADEKGEDTNG
ncbi:helix-turn-helix domain-containing protein [Thermoactinomyces sp. DSM 45892]|uniref:helix-turn-helix domain-containing protein n=1 Tax=Thermoactinomyces sp. DSM 45892 TaxID=1882753 RepID=UPI000897CB3C|nr:helix-turn-helix transcriptional regulator [Thermoactinomyces sp. DSM 45892]SDY88040.1 DNA-binding transcriptional regulator, XRE family [Thermoactinomyces sp. DSM 45892]